MLIFKPTKQSLIKRISDLDKATIKSTYPNIVIIEQESERLEHTRAILQTK